MPCGAAGVQLNLAAVRASTVPVAGKVLRELAPQVLRRTPKMISRKIRFHGQRPAPGAAAPEKRRAQANQ